MAGRDRSGSPTGADHGRATARGLAPDLANRSVDEFFAGFAWTATLDPTRMTAEAFLQAVIAPPPARLVRPPPAAT